MTATINASTTAGVVITPDNSGSIALQAAGIAVATFNSTGVNAGIQLPSYAAPTFSVTRSADQSITQNSYTRINFDSKNFDTGICYNNTGSTVTLNGVSAPAYSFAPNVAGYYLFFASLFNNPAGAGQYVTAVRKNGSNQSAAGNLVNGNAVGGGSTVPTTVLLYANGTSDYFDVVGYATTASPTVQSSSTFFGYMVRSA